MGCACAGTKSVVMNVNSILKSKDIAKRLSTNSKISLNVNGKPVNSHDGTSSHLYNSNIVIITKKGTTKRSIGFKKNYYYTTYETCWVNIVDFLSYKDVKQVGKVSK